MLTALEYTLAHPGVPGLDIVSLQSRCKVLQKKIYKKLLGEYLKGNTCVYRATGIFASSN